MDTALRKLLYRQWRLGGLQFSFLDALLAVCITGTGLCLRSTVIDYTPTDAKKLVGILLEYVLALLCAAIVHAYTGRRLRSLVTYGILVIYPTIVANGSLWNQGSVYYAVLIFLGLYLVLKRQRFLAALSTLAGLILAGLRLLQEPRTSLTAGWPNFYEIIGGEMFVNLYNRVSLLILAGMLLTGAYYFAGRRVRLTPERLLRCGLFLAILVPYFGPYMPATAGYIADVAALLYCMRWKESFYLPMGQLLVSYSAYAYALNGETKLPMVTFSVMLLLMLVKVGVDLFLDLRTEE